MPEASRRLPVLILAVLLPGLLFAAGTSRYLAFAHPGKLEILDQYQQKIQSSDPGSIRPFQPVRLVESFEILSDGLTKAMVVEAGGKRFYLVLDARQKPVNLAQAGLRVLSDAATPESGSARLSRPVTLLTGAGKTDGPVLAASGIQVEKTASANGKLLIWVPSLSASGWISSRDITGKAETNPAEVLPDWLEKTLEEANRVLVSAFEKTSRKNVRFSVIRQKDGWRVSVEGSDPVHFRRSFEALSRKLTLFASQDGFRTEPDETGIRLSPVSATGSTR